MLKRVVSIALIAVMAAMLIPSIASAEWTMYIYTDDGRTLNVRRDPCVADNIIGRLDYGTAVSVRMTNANGWACIDYGAGDGGVAYVQSRFLMSTPPASRSDSSSQGGQSAAVSDAAKTLNDMNAEFRSARRVMSIYTVVARPSRASGWVNLRWAPTSQSERITTCPQGKELIVLAELNNWLQVQDPETGMIGFISRQFVVRK